jgi:hypothetical protein
MRFFQGVSFKFHIFKDIFALNAWLFQKENSCLKKLSIKINSLFDKKQEISACISLHIFKI